MPSWRSSFAGEKIACVYHPLKLLTRAWQGVLDEVPSMALSPRAGIPLTF